MNKHLSVGRRNFLRASGLSMLALMPATAAIFNASKANASGFDVRIASNPGLENATLNTLIRAKGFLKEFDVNATIVNASGPAGPINALISGEADICLVSGYNRIVPSIESGAAVKIVGGAMMLPAHAIYTKRGDIKSLEDLIGRDFGVGERNGLLHVLMILRLRKAGIDPNLVTFLDKGSNASVYRSVVNGEVDAGLASVSNLVTQKEDGVYLVPGGEMWKELKEYTFQTAYASDRAIAENREGLVRTLAAYSKLYQYLQSPSSKNDFLAARQSVQTEFDKASAEMLWNFIQNNQPYAADLLVSGERIDYLQKLNLSLGLQRKMHPFSDVADMSLAREAIDLI